MLGPMQWKEESIDDVVVIMLNRGLKGGVEAALKDRIDELVGDGRLQLLISLRDLPYVDSTELGRLIRCHIAVRQAGGRVRLCDLSERMMTLMRVSRLDTVLDIYHSVDEALAAIHGQPGSEEAAAAPADPA